jgi:hypothetical protein
MWDEGMYQECRLPHPEYPWRLCNSPIGHKGPHYVPPESYNYEYWESGE